MLLLRRLIALCLFLPATAFAAVDIGGAAPDFTVKDTMGKEVMLSSLKGSIVVLEWTNHECPFVKKHYSKGDMQKLQKDYTAKGVAWLRVVSSAAGKPGHLTAEAANDLAAEQQVAATATLLDESGAIGHAYEAKTTPHMFIIGKDGNLAYQGAIDSIRSPDSADIAKAEPYVKQALDALLEGKPVAKASTQPYGCGIKYAQ